MSISIVLVHPTASPSWPRGRVYHSILRRSLHIPMHTCIVWQKYMCKYHEL